MSDSSLTMLVSKLIKPNMKSNVIQKYQLREIIANCLGHHYNYII